MLRARLWTLLLRGAGLKSGSPSLGSATSDVMTLGTASWFKPFSQDPAEADEQINNHGPHHRGRYHPIKHGMAQIFQPRAWEMNITMVCIGEAS